MMRLLLACLRGRVDTKRKGDLFDRVGLDPGKMARTFSKSNRQKVAVSSTLISDVEFLLVDSRLVASTRRWCSSFPA